MAVVDFEISVAVVDLSKVCPVAARLAVSPEQAYVMLDKVVSPKNYIGIVPAPGSRKSCIPGGAWPTFSPDKNITDGQTVHVSCSGCSASRLQNNFGFSSRPTAARREKLTYQSPNATKIE